MTYFLTAMEERLARAVFSDEPGILDNSVVSSTSQSSEYLRRPPTGYSLVHHHCEEEGRAAAESLRCRRTLRERAEQFAAEKIQSVVRGRQARAGRGGDRLEEESAEHPLRHPQNVAVGAAEAGLVTVHRPPGIAPQAKRPGRRCMVPSRLPAAPDLTVWTPLRGELSTAQQLETALVPKPPSEPARPHSTGGLHRVRRQRAHLSQSRRIFQFPIPQDESVTSIARPAQVDGSTVKDDDSAFLSTLRRLRGAMESDDGSAALDLKPLCMKKRAPGEWSAQWVMENSWPSRYRSVALKPEMSPGPDPQRRGLLAEQSILQPPCLRPSVDEDLGEAGGRNNPLTPVDLSQPARTLEAGAVSNDGRGSQQLSRAAVHSPTYCDGLEQAQLPNHCEPYRWTSVVLPPLQKQRVAPLPKESVLACRPIGQIGRKNAQGTILWSS